MGIPFRRQTKPTLAHERSTTLLVLSSHLHEEKKDLKEKTQMCWLR